MQVKTVFWVSCFNSGSLKFYDGDFDLKHVVQNTSGHELLICKLSKISVVGV